MGEDKEQKRPAREQKRQRHGSSSGERRPSRHQNDPDSPDTAPKAKAKPRQDSSDDDELPPLEERKETLLQLKTNGNRRRKIPPAPHPIPVRRPETEVAILLMEKITRKSYADLLPPKISINLIPPILILQVILQNQTKIAKNEGQRKREEADQST